MMDRWRDGKPEKTKGPQTGVQPVGDDILIIHQEFVIFMSWKCSIHDEKNLEICSTFAQRFAR